MEWPSVFMGICEILRKRSKCIKYQTSAVVVKGTQIIGIGYNGTASKQQECRDKWLAYWAENNIAMPYLEWVKTVEFKDLHSRWSCANEIHAEINALNWVSKYDIDDTCALYTYFSPCEQCAKQILAYGIKLLYYAIRYPGRQSSDEDGLTFLSARGVTCIQICLPG